MQRAALFVLAALVSGCNGVAVVGTGVATAQGSAAAPPVAAVTPDPVVPAVVAPPAGPSATPAAPDTSSRPVPLNSLRLHWVPPTQNTDGSSLNNLSAYRIYHAITDASALVPGVDLINPGLTGYQYDNLAPGSHYFAITAISADGVESVFSNVVEQVFP